MTPSVYPDGAVEGYAFAVVKIHPAPPMPAYKDNIDLLQMVLERQLTPEDAADIMMLERNLRVEPLLLRFLSFIFRHR